MKKILIREFSSKHNGTIQLFQKDNQYSVVVNNYEESGDSIEQIWEEVCKEFYQGEIPDTILVLGFATGSIMHAIRSLWPSCTVTGVELDPIMIDIAKKYFPQNLKDVNIVISDAVDYVRKLPDDHSIDLVITDCYIGGIEPKQMKTLRYLHKLKRISKRVLINQLFLPDTPSEMAKIAYLRELDATYTVRILKLPYNIIVEY